MKMLAAVKCEYEHITWIDGVGSNAGNVEGGTVGVISDAKNGNCGNNENHYYGGWK